MAFVTFSRPSLADQLKIGFFSLDRATQTQASEIIDLKEMTQVIQQLLKVIVKDHDPVNTPGVIYSANSLRKKTTLKWWSFHHKVCMFYVMVSGHINNAERH